MCLGIPGQVVTFTDPAEHLAKVDVNGVQRVISVRLLDPEPLAAGDWVLVHVGFAMAKIDEEEAEMTLRAMKRMGRAYDDELDAFGSTGIASQQEST
ncbi:MAG TPA: HypC/HybG/HupF family hydrogenase formation chaperone [Streptosporangiaceae bacterium]|nr:HypC/HybG/HupF family hydrogenase formation chaperone [Streptosporangiaceae bacterium]